ncbi:hypothetical protein C8Q74DRAFT_1363736 [Fomes fomentarius]|nr:hypothetical protein C8Q74DRAFT_1363736 [Fomes fomentarius]
MFFNTAIAKVVIALALVSAIAAEPTSLEARQIQTCTSLLCTPPPGTNTCGTGCSCAPVLPSTPPIPNVPGAERVLD